MREHGYYLYILTNKTNQRFYVGVTQNLINRCYEHATKKDLNSFTARYNIHKLIYFEEYQFIQDAIEREKQLKGWRREKKIGLIQKLNPTYRNLIADFQ